MTTGERIKGRRKEVGLSLNNLAVKADISPGYLSALENDKQSDPSLKKALQLATALDTTIGYLFSGVNVDKVCETCKFFLYGECHRFPPVYTGVKSVNIGYNRENYREITEDQDTWGFPEVEKTDRCGEWTPDETKGE